MIYLRTDTRNYATHTVSWIFLFYKKMLKKIFKFPQDLHLHEWPNKNIEEDLVEAVDEYEQRQKAEETKAGLLTSKIISFCKFYSFHIIHFSHSGFPIFTYKVVEHRQHSSLIYHHCR